MSDVTLYSKDGSAGGKVTLPPVFQTPLRVDLIRKAVRVARNNRRQPYGASPVAGERHSTQSIGKGKGMSRVPRLKQASDAALAPNNVGGRRAHPPEARTDYSLRMNRKERRLAIASALAATGNAETVKARGHDFTAKLPVIVDDAFVTGKTSELQERFEKIGVGADLERAKDGTHVRAGMGKLRGRAYRTPRSILLVIADGTAPAAYNLPGVDVVSAKRLSAEHLAPGGDAGRLTVYTQGALAHFKEAFA
jgi:large subunit ribosomal protein L4e